MPHKSAKKLAPIPPGEILSEDFMKPLGISQNRLARDIDVNPARVNDIVHGRSNVSWTPKFFCVLWKHGDSIYVRARSVRSRVNGEHGDKVHRIGVVGDVNCARGRSRAGSPLSRG